MEFQKQIEDIIKNMALQVDKNGVDAIKAGNNGPYFDVETNLRNIAHWCVIFSDYYLHSRNPAYKNYVIVLANEIISSKYYYQAGVYKCRECVGKDEMNGVIGAAWIIEGLVAASKATGNMEYYERAKHVFLAIKFNYKMGLWNRISLNGETLSIDATFNHQLWFAAAGALINNFKKDQSIQDMVNRFIKKLPDNITIRKNGRIGHFTYNDKNGILNKPVLLYKNIKSFVGEVKNSQSLAYKEAGYQTFNLLGMALLQDNVSYPISFFKSRKFKKCIQYVFSEEFFDALCNADRTKDSTHVPSQLNVSFNVFSFAYNSPAFELPRVIKCFCNGERSYEEIIKRFMEKQKELTYDNSKHLFSKNTDDPYTLTARIYEFIDNNENYWRCVANE